MPEPIWRKVVTEKQVPEEPGIPWTLVLEYLTPGKLMKIEVVVDAARAPDPVTGTWTPQDFTAACTADGDVKGTAQGNRQQQGTPFLPSASIGALIARIGGSTADTTLDAGTPAGTNPLRMGFAAGRTCVFSVPQMPLGALFMGVNDDMKRMAGLQGWLLVNVYEGL